MTEAASSAPLQLEAACTELAQDLKAKGKPNRYHARSILVPLGQLELESEDEAARALWLARILGLVAPVQEAWEAAVREEVSLACAEHIQAVDPRFLEHPRYDFAYTVGARARLEARLKGCEALDLELPEGLLDRVAEADARLEPYLGSKN